MLRQFILLGGLLLSHNGLQANDDAATIAVVINPALNSTDIKPAQLNVIFWRKQLYWPNGKRIKAVNLNSEHPLRQQFSQSVLGSVPAKQIDYWNGLYFNGVLPPHTVNSEEAVLRYVAINETAIGYVNACLVDARVKVLFWLMANSALVTNAPTTLQCNH